MMKNEEFEKAVGGASTDTLISALAIATISECARDTTLSVEQRGDIALNALRAYGLFCKMDNTRFWLNAFDEAPEMGEAFRPMFREILVDCGRIACDALEGQIKRVELLAGQLPSAERAERGERGRGRTP